MGYSDGRACSQWDRHAWDGAPVIGGACKVRVRGDDSELERGNLSPTLSWNPAQAMYSAANMLTELEAAYTSTSMTVHPPSLASVLASGGGVVADIVPSIDGFAYSLRLPALRTLDNATFLVLSTWDMPQITRTTHTLRSYSSLGVC